MPIVDFALASAMNRADDADLRHLLRVNHLPGEIVLSYEREPSFWATPALEGPLHQTMIVRDKSGRAVGMGSRSVRGLYVNGAVQRVGYMSQMRIDPAYAWGVSLPKVLTQGWDFFRQWHKDGATPYYLVSLVAGDDAKEGVGYRMMMRELPRWPTLQAVGGLLTFAIQVGRARAVPRLDRSMTLRRATEDDREAVAECLARNGRRRQFTPVWGADEMGDAIWTPDLTMANFWLVERAGRVIGTLARWNQRRFKQSVVRGYSDSLLKVRPYVNFAAKFGLAPRLPDIGEQVRHAFGSHLAVDDDDLRVAAALLAAVYNDAVAAQDDYLMVGLDTNHPFAPLIRRYRRVVYATQLFLGTWGEEVAQTRLLDARQMGAEIAVL